MKGTEQKCDTCGLNVDLWTEREIDPKSEKDRWGVRFRRYRSKGIIFDTRDLPESCVKENCLASQLLN